MPAASAGVPPATDPVPRWLRSGAAIAWRLLVLVAAIAVTAYALAYLRVVVLPVIVALLRQHGAAARRRAGSRATASPTARRPATVLLGAIAVLATALDDGRRGRRRASSPTSPTASRTASARPATRSREPPFNLSQADIDGTSTTAVEQLSATPAAR